MIGELGVVRSLLIAVMMTAAFASATAAADGPGDYLWKRRPLLVFAPANDDPRLAETVSRVDATRCDFAARDMVLGVILARGASTLDDNALGADEAQRLRDRYGVGRNAFAALLIGKDGGEKRRVDAVPDLPSIYALIDGMPMRNREVDDGANRC